MLSFKLAFRNIFVHGQRSVILFIAVGLASCFIFLFLSFVDGTIENFRDGVMPLYNPPSDIAIISREANEAMDGGAEWKEFLEKCIKDWPLLFEELLGQEGVASVAVGGLSVGLDIISEGERYRDFRFRSFDGGHAWQVNPYVTLRVGDWPGSGAEPEIMLHYMAAADLGVEPGDAVVLAGRDLFGQAVSQPVTLSGLYAPNQDNANLNSIAYMNHAAGTLVSGLNEGEAVYVDIKIADGYQKGTVVSGLKAWNEASGNRYSVDDKSQWDKNDGGVYETARTICLIMSALIVFVVSFGVMSVVSVNLHDRKREIGTYYCLGSEKGFLVLVYSTEILALNAAATLSGIALGLLFRLFLNGLGIRTEDSGLQMVFGGSSFTIGFNPDTVLFLCALMVGVTLVTALATLGPGLRVSPVAALRETE